MQSTLLSQLSEIFASAFVGEGLSEKFGEVVVSNRPDLGQFQCNGALPAAKQAGKPPRVIAEAILAQVQSRHADMFSELSLAGAGFINITVSADFLTKTALGVTSSTSLSAATSTPQKIVLDFGGYNTGKFPMFWHIRTTVLGECLQRLGKLLGHTIISDMHWGDWGLQMGMVLSEIHHRYSDWEGLKSPEAAAVAPLPFLAEDFIWLYPAASEACKTDPNRMAEAQQMTAALQDHEPLAYTIWKRFAGLSAEAALRDVKRLDVHFNLLLGESDAQPFIPAMLEDLKGRNIAESSEGAWIIPVAKPDDTYEVPPLILQKSNGAVLYATTDVATIQDRRDTLEPDSIIYVVDNRQSMHFVQLFRAAEKASYETINDRKIQLEHVGFGTVNGPGGKPFKTRDGEAMRLSDLMDLVVEKAAARLNEAGLGAEKTEEERAVMAEIIGLGALKFADLSTPRLSNYIFDLERFVSFEGDTGPYLQYAAVRLNAILEKAAAKGLQPAANLDGAAYNASEVGVLLQIALLPETLEKAWAERQPHILCSHLLLLGRAISRFYSDSPVLSEPDTAVASQRLLLCQIARDCLIKGLDILGIAVPQRM